MKKTSKTAIADSKDPYIRELQKFLAELRIVVSGIQEQMDLLHSLFEAA